ncbi:MAG: hypothetical protein IPN94_14875 [Sphingobacteriales bacterium]|nr:hypothetical protein [Sphingobacteriales bacterium]
MATATFGATAAEAQLLLPTPQALTPLLPPMPMAAQARQVPTLPYRPTPQLAFRVLTRFVQAATPRLQPTATEPICGAMAQPHQL